MELRCVQFNAVDIGGDLDPGQPQLFNRAIELPDSLRHVLQWQGREPHKRL